METRDRLPIHEILDQLKPQSQHNPIVMNALYAYVHGAATIDHCLIAAIHALSDVAERQAGELQMAAAVRRVVFEVPIPAELLAQLRKA